MVQQKVLVRSVNWLGDSVMMMPALVRLRAALPDSHISIFTPEKLADLWNYSAVDEILTFQPGESLRQVAQRLRAQRFDIGLVMPFSLRSALELWLAGIPRRIGYAHRGRSFLLSQALPKLPDIVEIHKRDPEEVKRLGSDRAPWLRRPIPLSSHHLYRYLHLAATLGADPDPVAPSLTVLEQEMQAAASKFRLRLDIAAPFFGMNPGAEYGRAKRWPAERFIAAGQEIQHRTGCRWVLLGGAADAHLVQEIAEAIQSEADRRRQLRGLPPEKAVWNLAGATTLRELCAVLKLCSLLVSNDSGPMHIGAAVGTPVVAPFGSTSPRLTGPGLPDAGYHRLLEADVACSPCFLRECPLNLECMKSISAKQIADAALQIVAT